MGAASGPGTVSPLLPQSTPERCQAVVTELARTRVDLDGGSGCRRPTGGFWIGVALVPRSMASRTRTPSRTTTASSAWALASAPGQSGAGCGRRPSARTEVGQGARHQAGTAAVIGVSPDRHGLRRPSISPRRRGRTTPPYRAAGCSRSQFDWCAAVAHSTGGSSRDIVVQDFWAPHRYLLSSAPRRIVMRRPPGTGPLGHR